MREIVFRILSNRTGHFDAEAVLQAQERSIAITAPTLEELHHEAREALIDRLGAAHCGYQVRFRHHPGFPFQALHRAWPRPSGLLPTLGNAS